MLLGVMESSRQRPMANGMNARPTMESPSSKATRGAPDLSRPKWTNLLMALGLVLFWVGFILWVLK